MQDNQQVTATLVEFYKEGDWIMNFNFQMLIRLSGISSLSKDVKLLDCGCATGHFLHLLQKRGFTNVYGVDAAAEMVKQTKELTRRPVFCCDALRISQVLTDDDFDVITAMNLQHHLGYEKEWDGFIRECRKVLKPQGMLFIREPYPTFLFNSLRWMSGYKLFFRIKLLHSRLQSLIDEKPLLYYFLDKWPRHYKECLKRNNFVIIKDFCWMGHRIVASRLEGKI